MFDYDYHYDYEFIHHKSAARRADIQHAGYTPLAPSSAAHPL